RPVRHAVLPGALQPLIQRVWRLAVATRRLSAARLALRAPVAAQALAPGLLGLLGLDVLLGRLPGAPLHHRCAAGVGLRCARLCRGRGAAASALAPGDGAPEQRALRGQTVASGAAANTSRARRSGVSEDSV